MKRLLCLLAITVALPLHAIAPELLEVTKQIERFPSVHEENVTESARLAKLFDLYWAAKMREFPELAEYVGYRGVEYLLPDSSGEGIALRHRLARLELAALDSIDRARLTPAEQINYDLLHRLLAVQVEGERFHALDPFHGDYDDNILAVLGLPGYMPARTVHDFENMLTRLRGFPRIVDDGIAQLDKGLKLGITPPRVTLRTVPDELATMITDDPKKGALAPFQRIPDTIPSAERERLQRTAAELYTQQVIPAIRKLQKYYAETYIPHARESIAVSDLPDGKAWYAYVLRYSTTTSLTPDQIHQLGLSEVQRIRKEMEGIIASTGYKGTFQEFLNYLRTDPRFFYDKPEDVVAGYRDIVKRVDPELIKLFGRLPRLPYGVKEMEKSPSAPSALYANGSLADGKPGWMLVNTYDLKARPKWGMESLAAHEAVPGHHLQYALVEELGELPAWRKWDVYPVFSEGWGLYAETLGAEVGLYKDPYSKFGQLNNEIWRAMRLVLDTGLHSRGWTRQQAIDYCHANSAKTDREIENEIDRYISYPGTVPAYKIGELKIRELRRYAEKALGEKFDVRAFHDEVLGNGQLPLDLLEARIKAWVAARAGG